MAGVRAGSLGNSIRGALGPCDGGDAEVVPPDGEGKSWSVLSRLKHTGVNIVVYEHSRRGKANSVAPTREDTHPAGHPLLRTLTPAPSPATGVYDSDSLSQGRRAAPVRRLIYAVSDLPAGMRTRSSWDQTTNAQGRRRRHTTACSWRTTR